MVTHAKNYLKCSQHVMIKVLGEERNSIKDIEHNLNHAFQFIFEQTNVYKLDLHS